MTLSVGAGRLAALLATILIVIAACGGSPATSAPSGASPDAGTPKQGGAITAAIEGELTSVDPRSTTTPCVGPRDLEHHRALLIFCKQDAPGPNLAELDRQS
jgi:hypothetical protein